MKNLLVRALLVFGIASLKVFAAFTPGNVVVLQCTNTSVGGAGALLEFNATGPTGYKVNLPSNGPNSIVFGNSSTLNHDISLSADGALIIVGGYSNSVTGVDASAGSVIPRVVATVKYDGTYARPFSSSALFTANSFRSATSDGFGNFWAMGGGGPNGTIYFNTSSSTLTAVQSTVGRAVAIANGNLCYTLGGGVSAFSGLPTTSSSGTLIISATAMGGGANSASFAIPVNPVVNSVAYLVDYNTSPALGIGHFHWDGSSWVWDYNIVLAGAQKAQHIAVDYSGATPVLYVTPAAATANNLYKITDPGPGAAQAVQTTIGTAAAGCAFRGVAMAPTQPALPSFTVQPVNTTNNYGSTATFGPVDATGANPNAWTWLKGSVLVTNGPTVNGSTVSGATTATLTVAGIAAGDAGTYYAVASNNGGSVTSSPAILALAGSSITTQLHSRTNAAGTTATFHVVSGGPPPLTYAWQFGVTLLSDGSSPSGSGATISGSATDTLTITGVQDADAGEYTVTVSDSTPADSSSTATLTVVDPPDITSQPGNQNKVVGATANFSVTATGGVLSYRWLRGAVVLTNGPSGTGSTISGATSSNLAIANVQLGDAAVAAYAVIVTNLAGSVTSSPSASLTVGQIPTVSFLNVSNWVGADVDFLATVTGTAPLHYVWKHDGASLNNDGHFSGVDTNDLHITAITTDDARRYTLTVSNSYGSTSVDGYLFVVVAAPEVSGIPGLILYDKFNYPVQPYSGFPAPAGWVNNWEYIISTYNQVSGRAAYWVREGNAYSTIESGFLRNPSQSTSGQYPWPGIDCSSQTQWYWSSAPNNNHLKFGGVDATNGAAYFSLILHITQGGALNTGQADTIAGFTSGDSVNGGANVDTYAYTLATLADGGAGDGYYLGVFKGGSVPVALGSGNGEWAYGKHLFRGGIHLIVGCYKYVSGGTTTNDDIVSLWIDPPTSSFGAVETNLPPPDAGGAHTNWSANAAITEFALRGTVPPASKRMTDLRIGKTWASVTGPYYPRLSIVSTPPDVTVTWPTKDSGYVLQESPGLSPASWVTNSLPPPYSVDGTGTNNTVTVPGGSATDFLRLVYPPR